MHQTAAGHFGPDFVMSYLSLGRRLAGFSVVEEAGPPDPRGSLGRSDAANETLSRAATPTAEAVSITRLGRSIGVGETSDEAHSQGPLGNKSHQIVTKAGLF